jgi:uncharacterized protein (TIGR01777 family)
MRILIIGATGFIGRELVKELSAGGHQVVAVTRDPKKAPEIPGNDISVVEWNGHSAPDLAVKLTGIDAIVNLAGESIASGRWTGKRKKKLIDSRVRIGQLIAEAIGISSQRLKVFIQGSASGYYGANVNDVTDETASSGKGFLADLAVDWEASVNAAGRSVDRMIWIRSGPVLGRNGGLMEKMLLPFKFFSGTVTGSGRQWLSWIHIHDEVRAIRFLLENDKCSGPYNLTAPEPVMLKDFIKLLAKITGRPAWMKVPGWVIKTVLGEMAADTVLASQNIYPGKLIKEGFRFEYEHLEPALMNLLKD